ncbi:MAG: DUF2111 domain-containing protein [Methanobacterium sp.]|uniref:DUF2111 domain-containing protein n=1 Tax=Methanobacterium sp. TaxID=2164 RepID=UPI003D646381|nr:DUF2111 domain-containing protein [Methanobacterium sp.]
MQITSSSKGKEIAPMALAIHKLLNKLPTTMRTKNAKGVRIEDGKVIDFDYTGPVLEKVLNNGKSMREIPESGAYSGIPVVVVPIKEHDKVIGVIGIVDITKGIFSDLKEITRRPELIKPNTQKGEFY